MASSISGKVKFFSSVKGYGFIVPDGGGPDVFVHIRDLRNSGLDELTKDQPVTFETAPGRGEKGPKAVNVAPVKQASAAA